MESNGYGADGVMDAAEHLMTNMYPSTGGASSSAGAGGGGVSVHVSAETGEAKPGTVGRVCVIYTYCFCWINLAECIYVKPLTLGSLACTSAPQGDEKGKHPFFASAESCKRSLMEADLVSIHKLLTLFSPPPVDLEKARDGKSMWWW